MNHRSQLVAGYERMVAERVGAGWEATLLTFMFNRLDPANGSSAEQMRIEVERIYSVILSRTIRVTTGKHFWRYPVWIGCLDYPVPKDDKDHIRDIVVNGGRHMHGVGLTLGNGRLKVPLADWIYENQRFLSGLEKPLHRLDAVSVTSDPEYVTRYVMKHVIRGKVGPDDIWVLPKTMSEVRDR